MNMGLGMRLSIEDSEIGVRLVSPDPVMYEPVKKGTEQEFEENALVGGKLNLEFLRAWLAGSSLKEDLSDFKLAVGFIEVYMERFTQEERFNLLAKGQFSAPLVQALREGDVGKIIYWSVMDNYFAPLIACCFDKNELDKHDAFTRAVEHNVRYWKISTFEFATLTYLWLKNVNRKGQDGNKIYTFSFAPEDSSLRDLWWTVISENKEIDIDLQDSDGRTIAHYLANCVDITEEELDNILNLEPDLSIKDKDGKTALDIAKDYPDSLIYQKLKEYADA